MPIVLLDDPANDTEWRGTLKPHDWHDGSTTTAT